MKTGFRSYASFLALALCGLTSFACSDEDNEDPGSETGAGGGGGADTGGPGETVTATQVASDYAAIVEASYADSLAEAKALHDAIHEFTDAPSEATLTAARAAWLESRDPYGETEAYRFYQGPIDNDIGDDDVEDGPEGLINAWPIDESYIDYVEGEEGAVVEGGIINLPGEFPTIDADLLVELNTKAGENAISTGYHAIEFLLWGQDKSETGPGDRPYTDYVEGEEGTAPNADRRAQYLRVAADLLVTNLTSVHDAWKEGDDTYRAKFLAQAPQDALTAIVLGMGSLSGAELSGERMAVAYDNKDQEDEHSCFSDNTKADLHNNATSVQNVLLGRYGDLDGAGIDDLVEAEDPALAQALRDQIQDAIDAIDAIPAPFDSAIQGDEQSAGPVAVITAVRALQKFTTTLEEAAVTLNIELSLPE